MQEIDKIRDEKYGRNRDPFAEEKAEQDAKLLDRVFLAKHEQVKNICFPFDSIVKRSFIPGR